MKRIGIVSDFLPIPTHSGDRQRLHSLIGQLTSRFSVDLVTPFPVWQRERRLMEHAFPGLTVLCYTRPIGIVGKATAWYRNFSARYRTATLGELTQRLGLCFKRDPRTPPSGFPPFISSLADTRKWACVIPEFLWMVRYVSHLAIPKILDMHDIQSERSRMLGAYGRPHVRYSSDEEIELWRQCNGILAIQHGEAEEVRRAVPSIPIWTFGPTFPRVPLARSRSKRLLFVGSNNPMNHDALSWFLPVWATFYSQFPDWKLDIVGSVGRSCRRQPGVFIHGQVDSLANFYADAALVVVPLRVGTGLKIKAIEGLAHSRPLLVHRNSADALGAFSRSMVVMGEDDALGKLVLATSPHLDSCYAALDSCWITFTAGQQDQDFLRYLAVLCGRA